MITIVNYKMGNIRSVVNALNYLGITSTVTSSPEEILQSEKLILPGVGSFFVAMENLKKLNLLEPLNEVALVLKRPVLGICLGMQLLADSGTEDGEIQGLGWIPGHVRRLEFQNPTYRIPHTGFNSVQFGKRKSILYQSLEECADFYFVHGYHLECDNEYVSGRVNYHESFVASIERDNIYGTQFHPEKSQANGLLVLRNFAQVM